MGNGTFLNRETEPLGAGRTHPLRDGDRLRLGSYEIEVRLSENAAWAGDARATSRSAASSSANADRFMLGPFDDDPFAAPRKTRA